MNSEERRAARYARRQLKRQAKKKRLAIICDDFEKVFTYRHLYLAYRKCILGVGWKASTQLYKANAVYNIYLTYKELMDGTFKSDGFFEFTLTERGKTRQIRSVTIHERVVQRCLCDFALTPMLSRQLIYDNGASSKNKGYTFALKRLITHLRRHYNKNGSDGYILLFDFSKFFDSLKHELLKSILTNTFNDPRILKLSYHFIDMFGERGIGLGSQISQNLALISVNKLDHYVKEKLRIKGYGRYMDDGYLIHESKEYLQKCLEDIRAICNELGVVLNLNKTRIAKLDKGFTFLKIRFFLTHSGKIVKKVYPQSVVRMRRKLKKFKNFVEQGRMSKFDIYQSLQSWLSHTLFLNAYRTRNSMKQLYYNLYGGDYVFKNC